MRTTTRTDVMVMAREGVRVDPVAAVGVDVDIAVVQMTYGVQQLVAHCFSDVVALAHRQVLIDHDGDRGGETVADPAGLD